MMHLLRVLHWSGDIKLHPTVEHIYSKYTRSVVCWPIASLIIGRSLFLDPMFVWLVAYNVLQDDCRPM